uniref:Angiopoietin-like 3 n=1 Tax=Myripristis murdjan TaxID=586833 RepID=A0A668AAK0_9TELE
MKLLCLLLLVASLEATLPTLDTSDKEEYPTLPSQVLTQTPTPTEAKSRFAMLDDVRLLANGLLQLGQSLREFVHKTKAQINDIFQKLNIFDRSFYQLSVVTSEIKEEEEELKKTTNFLKTNNEEIKNLSLEINSKINNILQERSQLQTKVGSLEDRLKGLSQSIVPADQLIEIRSLKEVIEAQERTISDLLKAVREQHDQLDHQKTKIKSLEEKVDKNSAYVTTKQAIGEKITHPTNKIQHELFDRGEKNSGVYTIKPNQSEPFSVYCEMGSDEGLTIIQNRNDGSVDFDQTWEKYEKGFGNLEKEFWLGLKKIHSLAGQGAYILRVDLADWKEEKHWAEYQFSLGSPSTHYTLHLSYISGDLPDAMANSTGISFSTKDRVSDNQRNSNCARNYTGGWWFSACGETNLNGRYLWLRAKGRSLRRKGVHWKSGSGTSYYLKTTKISIRSATATDNIN